MERSLLTPNQEVKLIKVNDNCANWSVKAFTRFGRIGFSLNPVLKAIHFKKHLLPYCNILREDHISASLGCPRREFKSGFKTAEVFTCVTSFQPPTTLILFLVNILYCRRTLPKLLRTETKLFVCDFLQNRLVKVKWNIKISPFSCYCRSPLGAFNLKFPLFHSIYIIMIVIIWESSFWKSFILMSRLEVSCNSRCKKKIFSLNHPFK